MFFRFIRATFANIFLYSLLLFPSVNTQAGDSSKVSMSLLSLTILGAVYLRGPSLQALLQEQFLEKSCSLNVKDGGLQEAVDRLDQNESCILLLRPGSVHEVDYPQMLGESRIKVAGDGPLLPGLEGVSVQLAHVDKDSYSLKGSGETIILGNDDIDHAFITPSGDFAGASLLEFSGSGGLGNVVVDLQGRIMVAALNPDEGWFKNVYTTVNPFSNPEYNARSCPGCFGKGKEGKGDSYEKVPASDKGQKGGADSPPPPPPSSPPSGSGGDDGKDNKKPEYGGDTGKGDSNDQEDSDNDEEGADNAKAEGAGVEAAKTLASDTSELKKEGGNFITRGWYSFREFFRGPKSKTAGGTDEPAVADSLLGSGNEGNKDSPDGIKDSASASTSTSELQVSPPKPARGTPDKPAVSKPDENESADKPAEDEPTEAAEIEQPPTEEAVIDLLNGINDDIDDNKEG